MNNLEKDKKKQIIKYFKCLFILIFVGSFFDFLINDVKVANIVNTIFFAIIVLIFIKILQITKKSVKSKLIIFPKVLNDSEVDKIIPDFNQEDFLYNAYNMFLETQNAYSNFDDKTLKALLVNDLYLDYKNSLQVLNDSKRKCIKEYFTKERFGITNIIIENGGVIAETYLQVNFYDYIVNHLGHIVSGHNNIKAYYIYKITYSTTPTHNKKVKFCPKCNAEIKNNTSKCEYCKTFLGPKNYNWVISNIEVISHRN